ncbi:MAG: tRNA pseudouridine(38-40) synthase TruA, partial [Bacteroidia bacterium]|nr:tRNA pseudouridine(38-40) synthase TruA [Bacteroidia bacterium]
MRYFIELAYNGTHYHGWQTQPDAISVQETLESCLSTLLRKEIKVTGAGRTDTGVHAKQLFAHFDHDPIEDLADLSYKLNSFLPKDIAINEIVKVDSEAHARFDAIERESQYLITLKMDPFQLEFAYR